MKTASIAIRCECGAERSVPYGEAWICETCGRRWNTGQIPVEAIEGRQRRMRRFKLEIAGFVLVAAAVFLPLILLVDPGYVVLAALLAFAWLFFYMPFWRRRVRRAVGEAPRWHLRPD